MQEAANRYQSGRPGLTVLRSVQALEADSQVIVRPRVSHAFDSSALNPAENRQP